MAIRAAYFEVRCYVSSSTCLEINHRNLTEMQFGFLEFDRHDGERNPERVLTPDLAYSGIGAVTAEILGAHIRLRAEHQLT